jgi:hypothetical protein
MRLSVLSLVGLLVSFVARAAEPKLQRRQISFERIL